MKKIRGHKRISKKIERWRLDYLNPNIELIKDRQYDYVKVWVSPFGNFRYIERDYKGPKSKNRILIVNALLDIYDYWDKELKKLDIPYYLKIWLYEPRVTSSQVVCAIGDRIEHYENLFLRNQNEILFPTDRYKLLNDRLNEFDWNNAIDEEIIENDFWPKEQYLKESDYYCNQRLYRNLEKRNIKKKDLTNEAESLIRYFVPKGDIWIGNKK